MLVWEEACPSLSARLVRLERGAWEDLERPRRRASVHCRFCQHRMEKMCSTQCPERRDWYENACLGHDHPLPCKSGLISSVGCALASGHDHGTQSKCVSSCNGNSPLQFFSWQPEASGLTKRPNARTPPHSTASCFRKASSIVAMAHVCELCSRLSVLCVQERFFSCPQ